VAEADAQRTKNFAEELKDMGEYLDFLQDVESLPNEFFSKDEIQSKAFDMMTATLRLITYQVKYIAKTFGGSEIAHFQANRYSSNDESTPN